MGELDNMRLSLAAAICVLSVALLAGCSASSAGMGSLPGSSNVGQPMVRATLPYTPRGGINPKDVLRLQAAGKIGYLGPRAEVEKALRQVQVHPLHVHSKKGSGAGILASLTYYDYILGINSKGTAVTKAFQTTGCTEPYGVKVDHSQNIWVGCYEGANSTPTAQEYSSNGTQLGSYNASCPLNWQSTSNTTCEDYFYGYSGYDSAADSSHVFVDGFFYGYDCSTPSCPYTEGSGVEYWPAGEPSATPTLVLLPYNSPVQNVYYMDEDTSGDLWLGFYGCLTSTCGYGLGEITSATTSPTFTVIENPGTYQANGGVYVSNGGNTLNVLDPESRITYQYSLPLSPGGSPAKKLGPNAPFGYPEGIGFNSTDKNVVLGDEAAWLNLGTVASNNWKQTKPVLVISDLFGAAYSPSDK